MNEKFYSLLLVTVFFTPEESNEKKITELITLS